MMDGPFLHLGCDMNERCQKAASATNLNEKFFHFFGLRESPFSANQDPRYLFSTRMVKQAWAELTCGIQTRNAFAVLTGEAGTGKTRLVRQLAEWLRQRETPTAFIFNPQLHTDDLFEFILAGFGIPPGERCGTKAPMCLNNWLFARYRAGRTAVLIVDEAQGLSTEMLESVRLLLNLETAQEKLLQIVLSGQPELNEKLNRPELRQLRQRITLRSWIRPLTLDETHTYIEHRLQIAGAGKESIFLPEAVNAAYEYSRGVPRVVNLLCENALIAGFAKAIKPVPEEVVDEVARKFQLDGFQPNSQTDWRVFTGPNLAAAEPAIPLAASPKGDLLAFSERHANRGIIHELSSLSGGRAPADSGEHVMEIELFPAASANCTREREGTMKVLDRPAAAPQQHAIQGRNERALHLLAIRARGQLKSMGSLMKNLFSLHRLSGWKSKFIALADIFHEWRRMGASLLRMKNSFSPHRLSGWKTKFIALAEIFHEWRRMRASLLRWLRQPVQMPRHYH
jgi:general secretion pathway protein A